MTSRKMRSALRSPLLALFLVAVFAGTAIATSASGFVGTPLSRVTMSEPVHFNTGAVKFQTKAAVDVATATVTVAPGGTSGWHSHPGIVIVSVKTGSVTRYDQTCAGTVHGAGTAFVETAGDGPGMVLNLSPTDVAVLYVTYVVPTGAALRIDEANPGC